MLLHQRARDRNRRHGTRQCEWGDDGHLTGRSKINEPLTHGLIQRERRVRVDDRVAMRTRAEGGLGQPQTQTDHVKAVLDLL